MKKLLLSGLLLSAFVSLNAQNCSELFFSEYVEGSNNDKALEIYNPTTSPITINNNYRILRYQNGASAAVAESTPQYYVVLGYHVIQPHDVWVVAIDKRDPNGTGTEVPVSAGLQAVVDTFVCPDYNISFAMSFNGDDAMGLQKFVGGNWVYADIIGEIGVDPGVSWSDEPPLYDDQLGAYYTLNQTLIRKSSIQKGVTVNPSPFIAPVEWDSLPNNTFSMLGFHNCACNAIGLKENVKYAEVKLFPNPANGNSLTVFSADKKIKSVTFINSLGQVVKSIAIENPSIKVNLDLNLAKGIYLSEIKFEDNSTTSEKLIIE